MTPGDGSAAVPSEPRRWTIWVHRASGHMVNDLGAWQRADLAPITVEEVGPVSEAEVEAARRTINTEVSVATLQQAIEGKPHAEEEIARAVLSAAREVKSDGD